MSESVGKLVLRVALGVAILLHGLAKLKSGVGGIGGMLTQAGLPPWIAYGVYLGEVLAPLLLIVGWYARFAAAVIAINMLFAVGLAHRGELFALTGQGGWALELQAMFLASALALALIGPGRYAINAR